MAYEERVAVQKILDERMTENFKNFMEKYNIKPKEPVVEKTQPKSVDKEEKNSRYVFQKTSRDWEFKMPKNPPEDKDVSYIKMLCMTREVFRDYQENADKMDEMLDTTVKGCLVLEKIGQIREKMAEVVQERYEKVRELKNLYKVLYDTEKMVHRLRNVSPEEFYEFKQRHKKKYSKIDKIVNSKKFEYREKKKRTKIMEQINEALSVLDKEIKKNKKKSSVILKVASDSFESETTSSSFAFERRVAPKVERLDLSELEGEPHNFAIDKNSSRRVSFSTPSVSSSVFGERESREDAETVVLNDSQRSSSDSWTRRYDTKYPTDSTAETQSLSQREDNLFLDVSTARELNDSLAAYIESEMNESKTDRTNEEEAREKSKKKLDSQVSINVEQATSNESGNSSEGDRNSKKVPRAEKSEEAEEKSLDDDSGFLLPKVPRRERKMAEVFDDTPRAEIDVDPIPPAEEKAPWITEETLQKIGEKLAEKVWEDREKLRGKDFAASLNVWEKPKIDELLSGEHSTEMKDSFDSFMIRIWGTIAEVLNRHLELFETGEEAKEHFLKEALKALRDRFLVDNFEWITEVQLCQRMEHLSLLDVDYRLYNRNRTPLDNREEIQLLQQFMDSTWHLYHPNRTAALLNELAQDEKDQLCVEVLREEVATYYE
ncbi:unnamed protein product [Caenorhabditis auriculariae]|uniref:Uncharacterized protein n=1 Tax=Caenorhabditis auriculariae TaxID=2777116 RepID=A0A8S1GZY8_9PELO|nr:unnamed protein product [Caenorhabditis auriculariae]